MKKITLFLLIGLLSSSLNAEEPEITPQDLLHEEKKDHCDTIIREVTLADSHQNFVDPLNSRGNHPIIDSIENEIPDGSLKRYIVFLLLNPARKIQEESKKRFKEFKESVICYHNKNDQEIATLKSDMQELKNKDQEKQKMIEELKQQVKYAVQIKVRDAAKDTTGG